MENTKTRDSILRMFFSCFGDMVINSENDNNSIPTMSDLSTKDWNLVSDSEKKEILSKSPVRIKAIYEEIKNIFTNTSFTSGTSVSKGGQNVKKSRQTKNKVFLTKTSSTSGTSVSKDGQNVKESKQTKKSKEISEDFELNK